jgi:hypothetical protein
MSLPLGFIARCLLLALVLDQHLTVFSALRVLADPYWSLLIEERKTSPGRGYAEARGLAARFARASVCPRKMVCLGRSLADARARAAKSLHFSKFWPLKGGGDGAVEK